MPTAKDQLDISKLPVHVAIVMDGNGRWATERGLNKIYGHQQGVISVRNVTEAAVEIGVQYLTLYTFSTENWGRPQAEVDAIMELLIDTIEKETPTLHSNNIVLMAIGDLSKLPENAAAKLERCINHTKNNTGLKLVLALSYSARWEITNAVKQISNSVKLGNLRIEDIDDSVISKHLTTKNIPDPDLLIRTSGELRISNFLLWQIAYSEFYFTQTYWPDFGKEEFYKAILDYQNRNRRFGK